MTATEFYSIRAHLGYSQAKLAEELQLTRTSISRIECGKQAVSPTVARLLQYVVAFHTEEAEAHTTAAPSGRRGY